MLNHKSYPHLFDTVLSHLDWQGLLAMRLTSSAMNDRVSAILYRHVVLCEPNEENQVLVVDPYHHRPLLRLDYPSLPPRVDGPETHGVEFSFQEVCARLGRYTRFLDCKGSATIFRGMGWEDVLQPLIARVGATRETTFDHPFAPGDGPKHQAYLFLNLTFLPSRDPGQFGCTIRTVWSRNLLKDQEELVVLVTTSDVDTAAPMGSIESLLQSMASRVQGGDFRKVTFVKTRTIGSPSSSEWDDFVAQLAEAWEFAHLPDPSVSFTHMALEEFQRSCGMSDFEIDVVTTPPGTKRLLPPMWELYMA
ncbi:hypothetical protein Q8F55_009226 [Vanrija albida]|uniref:F-box domain-containing protein n=1 Tax=Vanrija albida TaxID=181172 RepID=A0ABR3PTB6_9TREE